ncbi:MAG TPA: glycosyltransferase family 2 protein [Caulobacteraceae bacterium]
MSLSVVIRSRDEADRLRLTLASLTRQTAAVEVVVVDDGSTDHTAAVLAEAGPNLQLVVVRHAAAKGRSAASNAGARAACGDILLFLDGDTLAGPDLARRHIERHAGGPGLVGRGEVLHLRCTRFLTDPETGTPRPGQEARIGRLAPDELARMRVTRDQVLEDFAAIHRRAEPGVYPGAGPRRLHEIEMQALRHRPDCTVLWAAASGSNQSVARDAFLEVGGFNEALDINEHRELALRLCAAGARMAAVDAAFCYHLTHRSGWRDPLSETHWEAVFYAAHPTLAVKLLAVFWASLAPGRHLPPEARIGSLAELEAAARGATGVDYDAVRRGLGLPALPPAGAQASA